MIEDDLDVNEVICDFLRRAGYLVRSYPSAAALLASPLDANDLLVSDLNMPGTSGYDLCQAVRSREVDCRTPIILISGGYSNEERAKGIEAGADDFITKPFSGKDLHAKIRSLLDIRAKEREKHEQVHRLSHFLSPNLGALVTSQDDPLLRPHKAEVTVLFSDIRRYTALAERLEHDTLLEILGDYYTAVGSAAVKYDGTLGHLAGDGIMVFFNDPKPIENHRERAVEMALETRSALERLRHSWNARHFDLDFGIGIADGIAAIGRIGFEQFSQYSVIGPVANLASRLCDIADRGQILVSEGFVERMKFGKCETETIEEMAFKGIQRKVGVRNILSFQARSLSMEPANGFH